MKSVEFITESKSIFGKNYNQAYNLMIDAIDCGPFDGGCVTVAMALQQALGGEIVVLIGRPTRLNSQESAMHAAVYVDGKLVDGDGAAAPKTFIARFVENEMAHMGGTITGVRAIAGNDLPEAPRDAELAKKLAGLLSQ